MAPQTLRGLQKATAIVTIVGLGATVLVLFTHTADAGSWESPQQCYAAHMRFADGDYPLSSDDPSELREYCEKVYKYDGACDFTCQRTRIEWQFAIAWIYPGWLEKLVGSTARSMRDARVKAYFRTYR